MNQYTIVPHVADIRLHVEADTVEQLFKTALQGMNRILHKQYELELNTHPIPEEIVLSSPDITSLLIDFLSHVLTLSHIHKAIFSQVSLLQIEQNQLHAHLVGAKVSTFMTDIKAVTYHEAHVIKNDEGKYETIIVFDI